MRRTLCLFSITLFLLVPAVAQPQGRGGGFKKQAAPGELRKFDDVITKSAKTGAGIFLVHRIDDKVYFEIPKDGFDMLMLWQAEVAKAPAGVSWGGKSLGHRVVRWDRRGNKVYLWQVSFDKRADGKSIQHAVDSANMDSIIWSAFNVEAEGKDRSAVINATSLFLTRGPRFLDETRLSAAAAPSMTLAPTSRTSKPSRPTSRSAPCSRSSGGGGGGGFKKGGPVTPKGEGGGGRSITGVVHHSLVALPKRPMLGRFFDPRVGYFTQSFEDYAASKTWMVKRQYITRFRLEKKDPQAEVSPADQADRLLPEPGNPREVAAVSQEGHRGLAARVREGRLQERDRLQGRAEQGRGPDLGPRGRPLVGHPLGRRSHAERDGPARPRSALRRNHLGAHHLLARYRQARADVVLRAVLRGRSARDRRCP